MITKIKDNEKLSYDSPEDFKKRFLNDIEYLGYNECTKCKNTKYLKIRRLIPSTIRIGFVASIECPHCGNSIDIQYMDGNEEEMAYKHTHKFFGKEFVKDKWVQKDIFYKDYLIYSGILPDIDIHFIGDFRQFHSYNGSIIKDYLINEKCTGAQQLLKERNRVLENHNFDSKEKLPIPTNFNLFSSDIQIYQLCKVIASHIPYTTLPIDIEKHIQEFFSLSDDGSYYWISPYIMRDKLGYSGKTKFDNPSSELVPFQTPIQRFLNPMNKAITIPVCSNIFDEEIRNVF